MPARRAAPPSACPNRSDADGWLRLVRAYTVLGEKDQARASADDARRALDGNTEALQNLDKLIKELGLEG